MAGITVFGCDEGKPHCREYIEVKLIEPLVYGQLYEVSFWVRKLTRGGAVDNLGVAFSDTALFILTPVVLTLEPVWECSKTAGAWVDRWQRIGGTFRATGEDRYLLIGNFRPDSLTTFKPPKKDGLPYAYYYVDDVSLIKRPPYLVAPVFPEDLAVLKPESGMLVRLQGIHFDTDKSDLKPESRVELDKLADLLNTYPEMRIEVLGHTDNQGGDAYNQALSQRRADAVVEYLAGMGIKADRLDPKGRSFHQPVATNATPAGRRKNRRVEFLVLRI